MWNVALHVLVAKVDNNLRTSADIVTFIPASHAYDILADILNEIGAMKMAFYKKKCVTICNNILLLLRAKGPTEIKNII